MYADTVSAAMKTTIDECERRRKIQLAFNKKHNITPQTIKKSLQAGMEELAQEDAQEVVLSMVGQSEEEYVFSEVIARLEHDMEFAARNLQFEKAAVLRDKIKEIKDNVQWSKTIRLTLGNIYPEVFACALECGSFRSTADPN